MNLTEVFNQENKVLDLQIPFPIKEYNGEIIINEADVQLKLSNIGKGKTLISGNAKLEFELSCDRCLKPVATVVDIDFERE